MLAAAEPDCREWPLSQYAPVKADSETTGAIFGPLIGDLDGDGTPDVVFDCYMRGGGARMLAVLSSQRGKVAAVTGDDSPPPPAMRRIRWMIAPYQLPGRRGLSVVVFEYDGTGEPIVPASVYEFFDGRFVQLIEGE